MGKGGPDGFWVTFIGVAIRCVASHCACLHLSASSYGSSTINAILRTLID